MKLFSASASFTVEATFVMFVVIGVIMFLVEGAFLVHDRAVLTSDLCTYLEIGELKENDVREILQDRLVLLRIKRPSVEEGLLETKAVCEYHVTMSNLLFPRGLSKTASIEAKKSKLLPVELMWDKQVLEEIVPSSRADASEKEESVNH